MNNLFVNNGYIWYFIMDNFLSYYFSVFIMIYIWKLLYYYMYDHDVLFAGSKGFPVSGMHSFRLSSKLEPWLHPLP